MLVNTDPPAHTGERKLVSQAFSPRRIRRLEGWLADLVPALLADFDARTGDSDRDVMDTRPDHHCRERLAHRIADRYDDLYL
jgi:cytochrome P450